MTTCWLPSDNLWLDIREYAMNAMTEMPAPLVFTDAAATKVKIADRGGRQSRPQAAGLRHRRRLLGLPVRLHVRRSKQPRTTRAMEKNGVTLLIDPMSYQYLVGAEIDYQEGLEGAQFVIKNPNATSTCGCGSSFSRLRDVTRFLPRRGLQGPVFILGGIDRAQDARAARTGHGGQIAGAAGQRFARKPRERERLDFVDRNAERRGGRTERAGASAAARLVHQLSALLRAAAAHAVISVAPTQWD